LDWTSMTLVCSPGALAAISMGTACYRSGIPFPSLLAWLCFLLGHTLFVLPTCILSILLLCDRFSRPRALRVADIAVSVAIGVLACVIFRFANVAVQDLPDRADYAAGILYLLGSGLLCTVVFYLAPSFGHTEKTYEGGAPGLLGDTLAVTGTPATVGKPGDAPAPGDREEAVPRHVGFDLDYVLPQGEDESQIVWAI